MSIPPHVFSNGFYLFINECHEIIVTVEGQEAN